jgi:hypothetical protein
MHKWRGGGIWGSLRKHVAWEVKHHEKINEVLLQEGYSTRLKLLHDLMGGGSLLRLLVEYSILVILLIALDMLITGYLPHLLSQSFPGFETSDKETSDKIRSILDAGTSNFLGAQATLIGLIFPIAIGLVTLLVQREGSGSTNSDIQVYYNETFAYPVGVSCLGLIIVLAMQTFWPEHYPFHLDGKVCDNLVLKSALSLLHLLWFIINCIGLWHFLKTSLDFVQPRERTALRKKFAANHVIPSEISQHLRQSLYFNAPRLILEKTDDSVSNVILGGGGSLGSIPEVQITFLRPVILIDVRLKLLAFVIKNWSIRANGASDKKDYLSFPINIGEEVKGKAMLCARSGDAPLKSLEKWLIKRSFVFRRKKQ